MLAEMLGMFPLLLPGILLFYGLHPYRKRRPTIGHCMLAIAVLGAGLGVVLGAGTGVLPLDFAFLYALYALPLVWAALFLPEPGDGRVAILWFLIALVLASLLA